MTRALECVVQFPQPAMIAPLSVLFVPAAPARPGVGAGNKPVDLFFGLLLALLVGAVGSCLKQRVHCSTDEAIRDCVIGTELRFQEKLCAGLGNGRELRAQRWKEIGKRKRSDPQPEKRNRTGFQHVINEGHDLSIPANCTRHSIAGALGAGRVVFLYRGISALP